MLVENIRMVIWKYTARFLKKVPIFRYFAHFFEILWKNPHFVTIVTKSNKNSCFSWCDHGRKKFCDQDPQNMVKNPILWPHFDDSWSTKCTENLVLWPRFDSPLVTKFFCDHGCTGESSYFCCFSWLWSQNEVFFQKVSKIPENRHFFQQSRRIFLNDHPYMIKPGLRYFPI